MLRASAIGGFSKSLGFNSEGPTECVSLNNRPCQTRPTLVNIYSNKTLNYQLTVSVKFLFEFLIILMIHNSGKVKIWI